MAHHRHPGFDDGFDQFRLAPFTFELHRVGSRLHQRLHRIHRRLQTLASGQKRHIADDELIRRTAGNRGHMQRHEIHRGMHGGIKAVHHHGEAVTHQQRIHCGLIEHLRPTRSRSRSPWRVFRGYFWQRGIPPHSFESTCRHLLELFGPNRK